MPPEQSPFRKGFVKRVACAGFPRHGSRRAKVNEYGAGGIRFRFVLILIIMARDELWTTPVCLVDGLWGRLRRFRKSHQLILAGPTVCQMFLGVRGIALGSATPV
jgi:hypothetical protein